VDGAEACAGLAEGVEEVGAILHALGYRTPREVFDAGRAEACGFVDIAGAIPTTPQAQQQQPFDKLMRVKREQVALS
jgi:hypothetical protein